MKAAPLLRDWLHRLRQNGVHFHMRHRWQGWDDQNNLLFPTPQCYRSLLAGAVVLTPGGGNWPQLGSDGSWAPVFATRGIEIKKLRPSNCGFDVRWSKHFVTRFSGQPVKTVAITFTNSTGDRYSRQGEFMITRYGVEGELIYALSMPLRDEIAVHGQAIIHFDLAPGRTQQQLVDSLSQPRGKDSLASHLRKRASMRGVKAGLLREIVDHETLYDPVRLAAALKSLPLGAVRWSGLGLKPADRIYYLRMSLARCMRRRHAASTSL